MLSPNSLCCCFDDDSSACCKICAKLLLGFCIAHGKTLVTEGDFPKNLLSDKINSKVPSHVDVCSKLANTPT